METIVAEKMVAGGDCIGRLGGKIVFVPYALPGETLAVEITEERKDFARARISGIVAPSPGRVSPRCPLFGRCGGCNLQMAERAEQIRLKTDLLRAAFARAGFSQPLPDIAPVEGSPWEYRSRFQFHRAAAAGKRSVGLMPFDDDAQVGRRERGVPKCLPPVVPLDDCPVAVPHIRSLLRQRAFPPLLQERVCVFAGDSVRSASGAPIAFESDSPPVCRVELGGRTLRFDVRGFFQANLPLTERLAAAVRDGAPGGRALDLYAGCGVFALFLSDSAEHVTLVEHDRNSAAWAEANLRGKSHETFAVSGKTWAASPAARRRYDFVVADPPRAGLEPEVCRWLCESAPPQFRYVSCNPVALARDAVLLAAAGYQLSSLALFDFYPQTSHAEALACFETGG